MRKVLLSILLLFSLTSCTKDNTPPTVTLVGEESITVYLGEEYIEHSITATDDFTSKPIIEITGNVDINTVGEYEIVYTATDEAGNTSEVIRYIQVIRQPLETEIKTTLVYNYIDSVGIEIDFGIIRNSVSNCVIDVYQNEQLVQTKEITFYYKMAYEIDGLTEGVEYDFRISITYQYDEYDEETYTYEITSGTLSTLPNNYMTVLGSEKFNLLDQFIYLPYETYDIDEVEGMLIRLSKIDNSILEDLITYDIQLHLSNHTVTFSKYYYHLKGVVPSGWEHTGKTWDDIPGVGGNPVIAQIGQSNPGVTHGSSNLEYHELAHAIDLSMYRISETPIFINAHQKEKRLLFGLKTFYDDTDEYFAECFSLYMIDDESNAYLLETAPLTYQIIDDLFN